MRTRDLFRALAVLLAFSTWAHAGDKPLSVCLVSGSAEYKSDESLAAFQQYLETNYHVKCLRAFGKDKGNDLPGLDALDSADVMVLYTRRLTLPPEQMKRVRAFVDAGKPLVGIRTASHAFQNWEPDVKAIDREVFGGSYGGHYGTDMPARIRFNKPDHPILAGVEPFTTNGKLYKNPQLAPDTTLLLTASTSEAIEPVAWTRTRGSGWVFYTSLGVPEDFQNEPFRRMLAQAIFWVADRAPEKQARPK